MKKAFLLLFASILTGSIQAQNWCAPGAEWHLRSYMPMSAFYQDGYITIQPAAVYTINSDTVYGMNGIFHGKLYTSPATYTQVNLFTLYTYQSNNVIYMGFNGVSPFDTIANFNAVPGDKWKALFYGANLGVPTCTVERVTVLDTGHVLINGFNLKSLKVSMPYFTNTYTFTIVERIGNLTGFLFPLKRCDIDGFNFGYLTCYKDNVFPLYQPEGYTLPCDFTTVGKDEFTLEGLELNVFPNPAAEKVKIEFSGENSPEQVQLIVHDLLGREVLFQDCLSGIEVNLTNLKEGLYTLSFFSESKVLARRKLLVSE